MQVEARVQISVVHLLVFNLRGACIKGLFIAIGSMNGMIISM